MRSSALVRFQAAHTALSALLLLNYRPFQATAYLKLRRSSPFKRKPGLQRRVFSNHVSIFRHAARCLLLVIGEAGGLSFSWKVEDWETEALAAQAVLSSSTVNICGSLGSFGHAEYRA